MRLRPTGNKGPVAVSLKSFSRYHASESWTWERMALTRARVISAPADLRTHVEEVIGRTLKAPIDSSKIIADAREMRQKLAAQFPPGNRWELKFASGGLVDIEFIAQTLQLCAAPRGVDVLDANTIAALRKLGASGVLSANDAQSLIDSASLQHALTQVLAHRARWHARSRNRDAGSQGALGARRRLCRFRATGNAAGEGTVRRARDL